MSLPPGREKPHSNKHKAMRRMVFEKAEGTSMPKAEYQMHKRSGAVSLAPNCQKYVLRMIKKHFKLAKQKGAL